jgi:hypothetical protein
MSDGKASVISKWSLGGLSVKLVMSVSSRNENDDGGCVLACIDLTPRLAELALQRIESLGELQARDQDADEIYYWNYDAVFFDPFVGPGHDEESQDPLGATGEQLLKRLDKQQKGFVEVDSLFVVPEDELAAIECGQMIVRKEGVAFIAIPKHGSFYVETAQVPSEVLRRAARPS